MAKKSGDKGISDGVPSGGQNEGGGSDFGPDRDDQGGGAVNLFGDAEGAGDAVRRGPGRPKGALNRHTADFEKWYYAHGLTDPLEKLGAFVTADPIDLWVWMRGVLAKEMGTAAGHAQAPGLFSIIREQHACAKELAPYLHGKKPIQVEIADERLPQLAIILGTDQQTLARDLADAGTLQLGAPIEEDGEASEINDLQEGER